MNRVILNKWTNGLVEGMNRSLQKYLRCIIIGNDTNYTEWSTDSKLFPLAYNSEITTALGLSPYEMIFNQNQGNQSANSSKTHKACANLLENQFVII